MTSVYKVSKNSFDKTLQVPTSKSYANRILILAAISKKEVTISNLPKSTDVLKMLELFKKIGLEVEVIDDSVIIKNSFPECEGPDGLTLDTGDGGTTNRFIFPLLARGKNEYKLEAEGHMRNRPMGPLIKALRELGATVTENETCWISIKGPLVNNDRRIEVDCRDSTQFATGLALATADLDTKIIPTGLEASKAYYEMTKCLVKGFKRDEASWIVPVDFSSLAYPLALAALDGKVNITNCFEIDKLQADSVFIKVLDEMGLNVTFDSKGLTLSKIKHLMPFEIDGSTCPDLVPTLAFMASFAGGASNIKNIEILRHKESDRVEEVLSLLTSFGVKHEFDRETHNLIIYGNPASCVGPVDYNPPADHRIVMVAYLFMRMNSGGSLTNFSHVKKSFPDFFEVMG